MKLGILSWYWNIIQSNKKRIRAFNVWLNSRERYDGYDFECVRDLSCCLTSCRLTSPEEEKIEYPII